MSNDNRLAVLTALRTGYFTSAEVARCAGVTRSAVDRWARQESLDCRAIRAARVCAGWALLTGQPAPADITPVYRPGPRGRGKYRPCTTFEVGGVVKTVPLDWPSDTRALFMAHVRYAFDYWPATHSDADASYTLVRNAFERGEEKTLFTKS